MINQQPSDSISLLRTWCIPCLKARYLLTLLYGSSTLARMDVWPKTYLNVALLTL